MVKRPGECRWSCHREYLGKEKSGLIDSGPVMGEFRTAGGYEASIREGAKVIYRAEWHPGDGAPFLGPERFVKKIAKESVLPSISQRASLKDLLKSVAAKAGLSAETLLRKGREAVLEQGYLAFSGSGVSCLPSVKHQPGVAEESIDLGKSDNVEMFRHVSVSLDKTFEEACSRW